MTSAENPIVKIDDVSFMPQRIVKQEPRWIDMGLTTSLTGGFGQLRIKGMRPAQALDSFMVLTTQCQLELAGNIGEVEELLWGISRKEAGATTIYPAKVTVGEPTTFTVTYTAGGKGLPPGSRLRFAVPLAFSQPQTCAPDSPGFVACSSNDAPVMIESLDLSSETHEAYDIICYLPDGLPSAGHVNLRYRTAVTYLFPWRFEESDRRYWYTKVPPLNAAVAVDERQLFVSLSDEASHIVEFIPGAAERLHLFLPGRRREGHKFTLRGVFTDRYRNTPASGPMPVHFDLYLECGNDRTPLDIPAHGFTDEHLFQIALPDLKPGVYRAVAVEHGSGRTIAVSNPLQVIPADSAEEEVFWGEIHAHTEMSDGCGRFTALYRHARFEGCLDFAAGCDHACYFSDNQWEWMQDVTNSWNSPGKFVTLIGYEWAGKQVHRNIYTCDNRLVLFRGMYSPTSSIDTVWNFFKGNERVVGGPHAPLAHGLKWEHHEPSVERFVEIYSMWGASDSTDSPLAPVVISPNGISVNELLKSGVHLGFTGGGDCHEGRCGFSPEAPELQGKVPHTFAKRLAYRCGMTAALLPSLDRESLLYALRNRKTYATTGARILLSFSVSDVPMGACGKADKAEVKASIHACAPINRIEVIKDGEVIASKQGIGLDMNIEWTDPLPPKQKEHFYYIRVIQEDGQMAWSSPVWIRPRGKSGQRTLCAEQIESEGLDIDKVRMVFRPCRFSYYQRGSRGIQSISDTGPTGEVRSAASRRGQTS